jgi:Fe-S-cluster-containing dehydrogenase component
MTNIWEPEGPLYNVNVETARQGWERNQKIGLYETAAAAPWGLTPDWLVMYIDLKRCLGCFSCETSCKMEHDLPMGPRLIRVMQVGPKKVGKHTKAMYYPMNCFHCGEAPCVPPCPTGAIQKRAKDGIVWIDAEKCIGCRQCMQACPFGAIQYDSRTRKAIKCDYCMHRVDKGLQPACVTKCSTHCMYFGNPHHIMTYMRERTALGVASAYMDGRGNDTLCSPGYVFPEKNLFVPRIRRKPGALMGRITRITPPQKVKAKS